MLALALIATIACLKLSKPTKFLIRTQSWIAALIAIVVVANIICTGPMFTMLSLISGNGTLTQETSDAAVLRVEEIADKGIVLLQNDDGLLPLAANSNVNVFGWASTNPVYGGTGSGALNDDYHIVSLLEGLQNAGFQNNTELSGFYTDYRADRPAVAMFEQNWTLPEPAADTYPDALINNAREFSNTALIVISRPGAEQVDLPKNMTGLTYTENSDSYQDFPNGRHYLELSQSERDMVELVCANFDNVVLICNSSNTMNLSFVDDHPQIKSVVWCPGTGNNGFNSLGRILNGTVNLSGKAADTFIRDFTQAPYWNNFGFAVYDNMDEFRIADSDPYVPGTRPHYVRYVEDIYVGYKYWETAAAEGFIDYDSVVQYPFGHGLSYTSFTQEMGPISESSGAITFDVTVTNTGSVSGKDVVEAYYNPPYTNGGIEKASANLIALDKTDMLEPGASQVLTLTFNVEDMASYDMSGAGGYVLEAGDYVISINRDSHNVIDSQSYTVASDIDYTNGRSTDQAAPVNLFDFARGEIEYLSRADGFANFAAATAAAPSSMPEADKALFVNNSNYVIPTDSNAVMPTTGARNGMTVQELRGADYDDERWETLLDNLTISEMNNMIALGGYQTAPAASVGKVATTDCDGPASINNNFTQKASIGFPAGVVIAATWNTDLAHDFGASIGKMADEMDVSGWYAPAMNIHRTAFSGRNFEYYSEDGYLSGAMASTAINGAAESGVYSFMKHFALNDQETHRTDMLCTWSNEQAIWEIYLKPFEMCVKNYEGKSMAVMSSFNYIGNKYAGANPELLNAVLRDEWGFRGMVLTDYFGGYGYQDADIQVRNGNDFCLTPQMTEYSEMTDKTSATSLLAMRQACKNILYTTANSRAYANGAGGGLAGWEIAMYAISAVVILAAVAGEVVIVRNAKKKKEG